MINHTLPEPDQTRNYHETVCCLVKDAVLGPLPEPADRPGHIEILKFVHDQRLKLFNIRQEHEWKIFFAVAVLLGAVDAAILTTETMLVGWERVFWICACLAAGGACVIYELGLQRRNRTDRQVLDVIGCRLCQLGGIPLDSAVAWGVESPCRPGHEEDRSGLWAYYCQLVVIIIIVLVSAYVPCLIR